MKNLLYALASIFAFASPIKAQIPPDSIVDLEEIVVDVDSISANKGIPFAAHGDINQSLIMRDPSISTLIPGMSVVPRRHIPLGNTFVLEGINYIGIPWVLKSNHHFVSSALPGHSSLIEGNSTAINPSLDFSAKLRISEREIDEGVGVNLHPLRLGVSQGHRGETISYGLSVAQDVLPGPLIDGINELRIYGTGPEVDFLFQIGDSFLFQGYVTEHDMNISSLVEADTLREESAQRSILLQGRHDIGSMTLESTFNMQSGNIRAERFKEGFMREKLKEIDFSTVNFGLRHSTGIFGVGAYRLERVNSESVESESSDLIHSKKILGLMPYLDQIGSFFDNPVQANFKADIFDGEFHFSSYGAITIPLEFLELGIAVMQLYDPIIGEKLEEDGGLFDPVEGVNPQRVRKIEISLTKRFPQHNLGLSVQPLTGTLPKAGSNASVYGTVIQATHSWASASNSFFTSASASYRDLQMELNGETTTIFGSPRKEFRLLAGFRGESYSLATDVTFQFDNYLPDKENGFARIGDRFLLNPSLSVNRGNLSLNVTGINLLDLLNVRNVAFRADGEEIVLPAFLNLSGSYIH